MTSRHGSSVFVQSVCGKGPASRILLCLLLLLLAAPAAGNDNTPFTRVDLLEVADFIPDPDGIFSAESVLAHPDWRPASGRLPFPGAQRFWLRVSLDSADTSEPPLLVVSDARLKSVTTYWSSNGTPLRSAELSDRTPVAERPWPHRKLVFPIDRADADELLLLVQVNAGNFALPTIEMWDAAAFQTADTRELLWLGLFLGLLLTVAVYNLIAFTQLRESSHLFYSLFLLAGALAMLAWTGLGYQLLWPSSPWLQHRGVDLFLLGGLSFVCLFVLRLFKLGHRTPGQFVVLNALAGLALLAMLASPLLSQTELTLATTILALLVALTTLGVGILHWRDGNGAARCFALANALTLAGVVAMLFPQWLLHGLPLSPDEALMIGAAFGITLWSLALVNRITDERQSRREAEREALEAERLLREARERALAHEREAREAQQHALRLKDEANRNLEKQVRVRTQELEDVLKELSSANAQLETASITDGLTGVYNRRFFDQTLIREWHRAHRQQAPLSVLMLDLDHFKPINDDHGHQVGDLCLQEVGRTLRRVVTRAGDVAARYGGEEFAIILPNTPAEGALSIAENIRQRIAAIVPTDLMAANVRITASLGVATMTPELGGHPEDLINAADAAVYRAKTLGRNRVVLADTDTEASATGN